MTDKPAIVRHTGQRMRKQQGFTVGYSKVLELGDTKLLRMTKAAMQQFQNGGKVQLPAKMLADLDKKELFNTNKPIQFRLHSTRTNILCLCSINGFHDISDDFIFIPDWMIEYLDCQPKENLFFSDIQLPKVQSLKFKPENSQFYKIQDHKQFLQSLLPGFSAIMKNQWLCLQQNEQKYWLQVVDCQPEFASLIDTDVNVDFESAPDLDQYETNEKAALALNKLDINDFYQQNASIKPANQPQTQSVKFDKIEQHFIAKGQEDDDAVQKAMRQSQFLGKGRKM